MSITTNDHQAALRHEERDALGTALQSVLADVRRLEQHTRMFSAQGRA
jgi:hypothetical protein